MQSKLDELARKEEELRRINDALDIKKNQILSGVTEEEQKSGTNDDDKSSENSFDQFKGKNLGGAAHADEDEDEDYGDGNFENDLSGTASAK